MKYSLLELYKYHLPQLNNIAYEKYKIIWDIYTSDMQKLFNEYYDMNNYDNLCKYLLNYGEKIKIKNTISIVDINFIKSNEKSLKLSLSMSKYYWLGYINDKINIRKKNNTFGIFTNSDKVINQAIYLKIPCDIILFPNTEYKTNINELLSVTENSNIELYYEKNEKKYDNVLIRNFEFMHQYYLPYFELTKLPSTILLITNGLLKLNKNGNMFINIRIIYVNNVIEKIINLLSNSFKNVVITKSNALLDSNFIIECYDFLNNINDKTFNQLMELSNSQYTYSLCQFMHYYFHMVQKQIRFMYYIDPNKLPKDFSLNSKKILILHDFECQNNDLFNSTSKSLSLIQDMKNNYYNFLDTINLMLYQHIDENNVITNPIFFRRLNYQKIEKYLYILKKFNIPYDKTILNYLNQYNKSQILQLHSLDNNINFLLTKTSKFKSVFNFNLKVNKYDYNFKLHDIHDMYELAIKINNLTLNRIINKNKVPMVVKSITDNYARGVSRYINQYKKYKIKHNISNGFTKMWEILSSVNLLTNQKDKDINVFLIAEAPGQWIYCIDYYIKNKLDNIKKWDWRATSLDSAHPINIANFGPNIISDEYGFIKKYPDKWLWGADKTGDITKSENIRWYHQYVKEWAKPNLVTGDAGIQTDNSAIYQKLELSQVLMVAAVSAKGGNCIIKHFLPYIPEIPETKTANGFFMNYIYLYYLMFEDVYLIKPLSSNPISGEFYVIGKKFIGLNEKLFERMLQILDNFDVNICFFEKSSIPDHFMNQIIDFIGKITKLNVEFIEIQNLLLTCLTNRNEIIEKETDCRKYLNQKYIEEVNKAKFEKWVEVYDFV